MNKIEFRVYATFNPDLKVPVWQIYKLRDNLIIGQKIGGKEWDWSDYASAEAFCLAYNDKKAA